jgi:8-oxo-dGTP pyrophosphatase MutT (NUDIX family)
MNNMPKTLSSVGVDDFSAVEFRARFETRRSDSAFQKGGGDHVLNQGVSRHHSREYKAAAVLFGIIDRAEGASVLFTRRTETLSSHSGQVALPGGRIDPEDASSESAALRETHEEVGIAPSNIRILGQLGDYYSGSGYRITPVVGIIDPGFVLAINEHEVAEVFEVPLAFLMDRANHQVGSGVWDKKERFFYKMPYGEGRDAKPIWGGTAGIVRLIHDKVYG